MAIEGIGDKIMRILLDSKIREIKSDHVLSSNLQDLLDILKETGAEIDIGLLSLNDIEKTDSTIDFLVTEDRDIHQKASRKDLDDRVLLVEEALRIFNNYINKDTRIAPLPLKREYVSDLKKNTCPNSKDGSRGFQKKVERAGCTTEEMATLARFLSIN
jgi:hypothetical protein